jgi:hypothetical protein
MVSTGPISRSGSIRGFSTIDLGQGATPESIIPTNFSLTDLKARIDFIRENFDPDTLYTLINQILSHIQNENNPHQVTLAETGVNVVNLVYQAWLEQGNSGSLQDFYGVFFQVPDIDTSTGNPDSLMTVAGVQASISTHNLDPNAHQAIMDLVMPGTPPQALPTTAFDAKFGAPVNTVTTRSTSICVLDRNGNLVTVPPNTTAVDYSTGFASFPLWNARTNLVYPSDPNLQLQAVGSTNLINATAGTSPAWTLKVGPDGNPVTYLSENNAIGVHGYQFPIGVTVGNEYTTSIFVYPLTNTGGITFYFDQFPEFQLMLDLTDYSYTVTGENVIGYVQVLSNGWIRVGMQYVAPTTTVPNFIIAKTLTAVIGNTIPYQGNDQFLFGVFGCQHIADCGMSPYIPTTTDRASHDLTVVQMTINLVNATTGLLAVEYNHPSTISSQKRSLISLDPSLQIYTQSGTLTATAEDTDSLAVSIPITDTYNQQCFLAFSFTPGLNKLGATNVEKTTQPAGTINLSSGTTTITLGSSSTPFNGSISRFSLYPISDTNEEIEFLIGEA